MTIMHAPPRCFPERDRLIDFEINILCVDGHRHPIRTLVGVAHILCELSQVAV